MVNIENLTHEQIKRFKELNHEIVTDVMDCLKFEKEQEEPELISEIFRAGLDLISLIELYREGLEKKNLLPLSKYNESIQNIRILSDIVDEGLLELVGEASDIDD